MKSDKPFIEQQYLHKGELRSRYLTKGRGRGGRYETGNLLNYLGERVKVLYRYYTINNEYRNYHARILWLTGKYKGQESSFTL